MTAAATRKKPSPVDVHVGSRVRMRRMMQNMSQEKLAEGVGVTFQQIQKYEKGTNRIGASRLQQFSEILQVPISFFFEELFVAAMTGTGITPGGVDRDALASVNRMTVDRDGLRLIEAFVKIKERKTKALLADLAEQLIS